MSDARPLRADDRCGHEAESKPFHRADFERGPRSLLNEGRFANAVVQRWTHGGEDWVVKDFGSRGIVVRNVIGRYLVRREVRALRRVAAMRAVPHGAFRLDRFALAYRYVPGRSLRGLPGDAVPPDFFPELETLVRELHEVLRIAHCDLRTSKNIVVTDDGHPLLLDFQSAVDTRRLPRRLRRLLEDVDLAAIYKHWFKRHPDTLGVARGDLLRRVGRLRAHWPIRGYMGMRGIARLR